MTYIAFAETVLGPFAVVSAEEDFLRADLLELPLAVIGDYALLDDGPPGAPADYRWDAEAQDYVLHVDPAALASARVAALAAIASQRWEATQFFLYDGVRTQADKAVGVITARLALRRELEIPDSIEMKFKLGDGEFRAWTKAQEVAFGVAVANHVQGCFDREDELTGLVAAASTKDEIEAVVALAATSWPQ